MMSSLLNDRFVVHPWMTHAFSYSLEFLGVLILERWKRGECRTGSFCTSLLWNLFMCHYQLRVTMCHIHMMASLYFVHFTVACNASPVISWLWVPFVLCVACYCQSDSRLYLNCRFVVFILGSSGYQQVAVGSRNRRVIEVSITHIGCECVVVVCLVSE